MDELGRMKTGPWTSAEILSLRQHARLGLVAVAQLLDRSPSSVERCAHRQRISLRRAGERRGRVLGECAGLPWPDATREQILAGKADPAETERRLVDDLDEPLCPSCTIRPIRVWTTGLCRVCHLRRQAEHNMELLSEKEAQREAWRTRQQLHRDRKAP